MSKRRKKVRGNPAASNDDAAPPSQPEKRRGLRAFRDARSQGKGPARNPQRRPSEMQDGFLTEANQRAAEGEYSSPRILIYALIGITMFMFTYVHLYAMPQLRHFAEGLSMPGARLTGFSAADIERLRTVMEDTTTGQLNFLHITAGVIFPIAFFLATWAAVGILGPRGRWRWVVVAGAAGFLVLDITKNILIDRILSQDQLNESLVITASAFTMVSWVLLTLLSLVVVGVVVRDIVRMRQGKAGV